MATRKKKPKARKKNPAAVAMVKLRTRALTPARRREIAQRAAAARWAKTKPRPPRAPDDAKRTAA
jgi:hypothetical protein